MSADRTHVTQAMVEGRRRWMDERRATEQAEREATARAERRAQLRHDRDPDVRTYRKEKKAVDRRTARQIEAARVEFNAMLARLAEQPRRGGRPRKRADTGVFA